MIPYIRTYRYLPNIMDELMKDDCHGGRTEKSIRYSAPPVNVKETENGYDIEIAAPGFEKDELKVAVDKSTLTISSTREEKSIKKDLNYLKKEFGKNSFNRSFELPENSETEKIEASHKNGILFIKIPKKAIIQIPVQEVEVK